MWFIKGVLKYFVLILAAIAGFFLFGVPALMWLIEHSPIAFALGVAVLIAFFVMVFLVARASYYREKHRLAAAASSCKPA